MYTDKFRSTFCPTTLAIQLWPWSSIPVPRPQEFVLSRVLNLPGPLLKDTNMLDTVSQSKSVIQMAKERQAEAQVLCIISARLSKTQLYLTVVLCLFPSSSPRRCNRSSWRSGQTSWPWRNTARCSTWSSASCASCTPTTTSPSNLSSLFTTRPFRNGTEARGGLGRPLPVRRNSLRR